MLMDKREVTLTMLVMGFIFFICLGMLELIQINDPGSGVYGYSNLGYHVFMAFPMLLLISGMFASGVAMLVMLIISCYNHFWVPHF